MAITIKPADKSVCIVILNTSDYIAAIEHQLHNTKYYRPLPQALPPHTALLKHQILGTVMGKKASGTVKTYLLALKQFEPLPL